MPVRLKDIARDLGVSLITVSKAVRGMEDISEETRQRVLKRMAELNYRPNMMARGLASGKTYIVGLVVPDLLHPFFAEFAKSLNGVLRKHNYGLILTSSEEDPQIEQQEIRTVLARGIDALLIASCQHTLQGFYGVDDQRTPFATVLFFRPTFRRPLTADEQGKYLKLFNLGAADGFAAGMQWVITALLQSPKFLYRTEIGRHTGGVLEHVGQHLADEDVVDGEQGQVGRCLRDDALRCDEAA